MKEGLTMLEAYRAMYEFIHRYFIASGEPEDIRYLLMVIPLSTKTNPALLNDVSEGFEPLDRALWSDWLKGITRIANAQNKQVSNKLSVLEAYSAMYAFLEIWYEIGKKLEEPIGELLEKMKFMENENKLDVDEWLLNRGKPSDAIWAEWLLAINLVTCENGNSISC